MQNDRDNSRLRDTVVALITGNTNYAQEATQCFVNPDTLEGASSGLHGPSSILCCHLYTIRQSLIIKIAGSLPGATMQQVDESLKIALHL